MIDLLIWLAAIMLVVGGLIGLVMPILSGPLLLFAGLWMAAWAESYIFVGTGTLVTLAVLAALASLADFVAGAFGARRYGASARSVWGAVWGAAIGIFFGLPSWRSELRCWACICWSDLFSMSDYKVSSERIGQNSLSGCSLSGRKKSKER